MQGYVQNAFAALAEELNAGDDDVQMVITQMAALTTQSQLTISTKYGSRDKCISHRGNQPACGKSTSDATAVCGICINVQYNKSAGNTNPTTHAAIQHPKFWLFLACRTWSRWKAQRTWTRKTCKCRTPRAYTICKFHWTWWPRWPTPIGGGRGGSAAPFCHKTPNHGIGGIIIPAKMARLTKC